MEPAAILIGALEVYVCRPAQLGTERKNRFMARAGVEPDVENVRLALGLMPATLHAREAVRQELFGRPFVPRVAALLLEEVRGAIDELLGQEHFAAARASHRRDRHTPRTLARDAPVWPVRQHVVDALLAPRRQPFHLLHRGQRLLAQGELPHL